MRSITVGPAPFLSTATIPVLPDAGGDVEPERLQARGQFGGGLNFLKPEFGIAMEVDVERVDVGKDRVDFGWGRSRPAAGPDCAESVQVATSATARLRARRSIDVRPA